MNVVIVFAVLAVVLFGAAYLTKRRFGLLGLALAAGSILSTIWDSTAGLLVSASGVVPKGPLTDAVTLSLLVLLPPIILLFHGTTYKTHLPRIIGSLAFAVLALAFLVVPLGHALPLSGVGAQAYQWLEINRNLVISGGMILAVIDLFFTKPASHHTEKRSHH
jgi:hypothetical protein